MLLFLKYNRDMWDVHTVTEMFRRESGAAVHEDDSGLALTSAAHRFRALIQLGRDGRRKIRCCIVRRHENVLDARQAAALFERQNLEPAQIEWRGAFHGKKVSRIQPKFR